MVEYMVPISALQFLNEAGTGLSVILFIVK